MATYNSLQKTGPRTYPVSSFGTGGRTGHRERASFALTAALAAGDVINLFDLPVGARVMGGFIKSDKLDNGGAPAITLNVGIAGTPALFWSASNVAQAGGVDANMVAAGRDYLVAGKTPVIATVLAGPQTGATTGNLIVIIEYIVQEPA